MANPNIELFRRTSPKHKLEIIGKLTDSEVLSITSGTIIRMVKEVGSKEGKSRDRELYISHDRRQGNNWNSTVEAIKLTKGKLYVWAYIQYGSTDTTHILPYEQFFSKGEFMGKIETTDHYGNPQTYYYHYYSPDKAKVLRSIMKEYIHRKYKDKFEN